MPTGPKREGGRASAQDLWKALGLSASEVAAYESLIEAGPQSASALAKATEQSRGRIYMLLRGLAERGFVREEPGNPSLFHAVAPHEVLQLAASAARRQAKELETAARELAAGQVAPPASAVAADKPQVRLLQGRKAVALETTRMLDRAEQRFYVAGGGNLAARLAASPSFLRAVRAKAAGGLNVAISTSSHGPDVGDAFSDLQPALVTTFLPPRAFPITLLVGDVEAMLVSVDPDDAAPLRGDDRGILLQSKSIADGFATWFERVALSTQGVEQAGFASLEQARVVLARAIGAAAQEVLVMGPAGWLQLVLDGQPEAGARTGGVAGPEMRLVTETNPSAWRLAKRALAEGWQVRLVRSVPIWAVVVDGSHAFAGVPGEAGLEAASVRARRDAADAEHYRVIFTDLWKAGAPILKNTEAQN